MELLNICSKERTKCGAYEVYNITRGRIVSAVVLYWDGETRAEMPLFCCKGLVSRERRAKLPLIYFELASVARKKGESTFDLLE